MGLEGRQQPWVEVMRRRPGLGARWGTWFSPCGGPPSCDMMCLVCVMCGIQSVSCAELSLSYVLDLVCPICGILFVLCEVFSLCYVQASACLMCWLRRPLWLAPSLRPRRQVLLAEVAVLPERTNIFIPNMQSWAWGTMVLCRGHS